MTRLDPRSRVLILLFLLKTDKAGGSAADNIDNCVYWLTNRVSEGCAYLSVVTLWRVSLVDVEVLRW